MLNVLKSLLERLDEVTFADPQMLPLFYPLGLLFILTLLVLSWRIFTRPAPMHGSKYALFGTMKYIFSVLAVVAFCLLALARPYLPQGSIQWKEGPVNCIVVIDQSFSMFAPDVHPIRLAVAKAHARALVEKSILKPGDKVALFVFNKNSRICVYLTNYFRRLPEGIDRITPPRSMKRHLAKWITLNDDSYWFTDFALVLNNIYQAIDMQDSSMGQEIPVKRSNTFIFFFSDGGDESRNLRKINDALKELKIRGIKIYPIGIGTSYGYKLASILKWHGYEAGTHFDAKILKDFGNEYTRLDKRTLGLLKDGTGGEMTTIESNVDSAMTFMRRVVDSHRSSDIEPYYEDDRYELWPYCLYGAMFFVGLLVLSVRI